MVKANMSKQSLSQTRQFHFLLADWPFLYRHDRNGAHVIWPFAPLVTFRCWLFRRIYWTPEKRARLGRDDALAKHPELRAIEARLKAAQEQSRSSEEGTFQAFEASCDVDQFIDLYEQKRDELDRLLPPTRPLVSRILQALRRDTIAGYLQGCIQSALATLTQEFRERNVSRRPLAHTRKGTASVAQQYANLRRRLALKFKSSASNDKDTAPIANSAQFGSNPEESGDHCEPLFVDSATSEFEHDSPDQTSDQRSRSISFESTHENVVPFPRRHRMPIAASKLTGPDNQDIGTVAVGMDQGRRALVGKYLVTIWSTRVTANGNLDYIVDLTSTYEVADANHFAVNVLDMLLASESVAEPTVRGHGPHFETSTVSEIARFSLCVSAARGSDADHVTVVILGPFPSAIVGDELVELFGRPREREALRDLFNRKIPAAWHAEGLDRRQPGNIAWVSDRLIPLIGSEEQQTEWLKTRIVDLNSIPDPD